TSTARAPSEQWPSRWLRAGTRDPSSGTTSPICCSTTSATSIAPRPRSYQSGSPVPPPDLSFPSEDQVHAGGSFTNGRTGVGRVLWGRGGGGGPAAGAPGGGRRSGEGLWGRGPGSSPG